MKKIFMAFMLCLISIMSFGQLNLSSNGGNTKEDKISGNMYARIILNNNVYQLCVKDNQSTNHIVVTLGNDKESALFSLNQLYDWLDKAKKDDYFTVNEAGVDITIYKHISNGFMVSYGDAEFCKETYKAQMISAFVGGYYGQNNNKNPMFGYVGNNVISKAIKKLK